MKMRTLNCILQDLIQPQFFKKGNSFSEINDGVDMNIPIKAGSQNVVFELGYFIGRLKRSHVAALVKGNVEIPSDVNGFAYIGVDNAGFWKMKVSQELKACGYDVDMNKIV